MIFTVKFNILSSKMPKLTPNDLKMAYFGPFCQIFDPVKGRNVIVDPPDGQHLVSLVILHNKTSNQYFTGSKIGQNESKQAILGSFGVILAIFELKMVNLRVKIKFLTLWAVIFRFPWSFDIRKHQTSTLPGRKSAKNGQNRPFWGHLGHF